MLTLFSGACGGWDLGMERAGYQVVAACEFDPWRRAVLQRNFPNTKVYDDVRGLTAAQLLADLGRLPDVIVGSPPCQDASSANHYGRGVDGERTGLFAEFVRLVGEVRPAWFAAENVARLASRGLDRLLGDLEAHGYAVWPLLMAAKDFGAPHERDRLWIVGVRSDVADADRGIKQNGRPLPAGRRERCAKAAAGDWASADANEARRANGQMESSVRAAEEPEHRRTFASAWPDWNGGFAGFGRVDDGLPRGVARAALAAYGDAVVPQIAEAIGRAMLRVAA